MSRTEFSFELLTQDGKARLGQISTPRGIIDTPAFMPVGTQGTVKGIFTEDILKTNTQIILGNTYHLLLRPGIEILNKFSGLHDFMNWKKPILTDSGGYQIMSLSKLNKIDAKIGAIFRSHLDGKKIILSPEKSIQVQKSINSDIVMVLDECPKLTNDKKILPSVLELVESTFSNEARRVLLPLIDPDSNTNLFSQKFIEGIELDEENFLINWIQSSHQWKIVISLEYLLKEEKVSILKNIKWKKIYNFDYTFFNSNQINYLKRNFTYKEIAINRKNNMYSILEKTLILKSVELFQEIPGEVLSNIAQISKELNLEAGQSIFMEGDHGDSLYIIIDGGVSIIKEKKEIALLGHGNCIGEMALLDQEPRSADAICIKDSILLEIDQLGFYELMASNDVIMKQIIRILTKRLRETNKKLTVGLK